MPTQKGKDAAAKGAAAQKKSEETVMWVRLPRPMKVAELSKLGLQGGGCYGGDTCIAATHMRDDAGIVIQVSSAEALRRAQLTRRDPCFGGDTCIV